MQSGLVQQSDRNKTHAWICTPPGFDVLALASILNMAQGEEIEGRLESAVWCSMEELWILTHIRICTPPGFDALASASTLHMAYGEEKRGRLESAVWCSAAECWNGDAVGCRDGCLRSMWLEALGTCSREHGWMMGAR